MTSIISYYNLLLELWDWSLDNCTVTEMKARIFGLVLVCNLLQHSASLNVCVCLQRKSIYAAEGLSLPDHPNIDEHENR